MAAYANGVGVTDSNSSPPLRGERRGNQKAEGDSHSSLVHQSQRGRHYGTVGKGKVRENGHLIHSISSSDTLQGIALKYGVTVSDIQRANLLLGSESIHKYKVLKIPLSCHSSPQGSPRIDSQRKNFRTSPSLLVSSTEEEEEEVRRKPASLVAGERDIMSLLSAVDQQLMVSKSFADKLAEKNSFLVQPPDAYNRERQIDREKTSDTEDEDTLSDKVKRVFSRTYKWSPAKDNEVREKVEDELFQL